MSDHRVDIDNETIQFEGRWLGREELAKVIRTALDNGNYNVARPSAALESLNAALGDLRTVAFRASPGLSDALIQAAQRQNRTPGALIRDALAQYLGAAAAVSAPEEKPATTPPPGLRPAFIPGPGALKAVAAQAPVPSVVVEPSQKPAAVVTEPASPEDEKEAVDLQPKTPASESQEAIERRWFGN